VGVPRRITPRRRCLLERAVEVVPDVFDVFDADAEPQQSGGEVLLAGDSGSSFDG